MVGAVFLVCGTWSALRLQAEWSPMSASPTQIHLEVLSETLSIQVRFAAGCLFLSTFLAALAVAWFLPDIVPGAMCGTGVLQAAGPEAKRAVAMRLFGCTGLYIWLVVDRLNRSRPEAPITVLSARTLLAVFPLAVLGVVSTTTSVAALDVQKPVDCCAAVYAAAGGGVAAGWISRIPGSVWTVVFFIFSGLLPALFLMTRFARERFAERLAVFLAGAGLLWTGAAAAALLEVFAAYHYGVLHHDCAWCLLLPEHRGVGFPIYAALLVVFAESTCIPVLSGIRRREPSLVDAVGARMRSASIRIMTAFGLFQVLVLVPPVVWRIRFGVWMG
jgi:hypothetical protein